MRAEAETANIRTRSRRDLLFQGFVFRQCSHKLCRAAECGNGYVQRDDCLQHLAGNSADDRAQRRTAVNQLRQLRAAGVFDVAVWRGDILLSRADGQLEVRARRLYRSGHRRYGAHRHNCTRTKQCNHSVRSGLGVRAVRVFAPGQVAENFDAPRLWRGGESDCVDHIHLRRDGSDVNQRHGRSSAFGRCHRPDAEVTI